MYLVYRQRRMAYTFPLSETVCVFRITSETPEQTRSPASRISNDKACCFPGCGMHPQLLPAGRLCWLMATLANSLKKPQNACPICDPDPDWFLLNRAGSQAHCLPPQESKSASKALLLLCPAPSSWCVFELDQSNSD